MFFVYFCYCLDKFWFEEKKLSPKAVNQEMDTQVLSSSVNYAAAP